MSMMRGGSASLMRRMTQDPDVADHQLTQGVLRRILRFAKPYRAMITVFIVLVVISSALAVTPPLLFKQIIDEGVLEQNRPLLIKLSAMVAGIAVLQAVIGLVQRWFSSKIGEGLIFDLRTQVFDHVVRMPLAFFTRTQTGKLVSRLNSDVIGAQQAFTSTLSTVLSNLISLVLVLAAMLVLSWQLTLAALVMLPIFLIPAKIVGRKLADLTRQQMQLNGEMSTSMTERFSVSGALLVTLFGRLADEHNQFADPGRGGARRLGPYRHERALLHDLARPGGGAGHRPGVRRRRLPGHRRAADRRHADRARRPARSALRAADPADQSADRRDERPGQLRSGVRGAGPGADDPRRRGCRARQRSAVGGLRERRASPTRAPRTCHWPVWSRSPRSTSGRTPRCCTTCPSPSRRARPSRWSAAPAAARRR